MNKVHILPPEIISKIAAGEVIERPASVIKELMENSLDAQTSSIEIHLKDAGKTLIHIKDTGSGIEPDDLEKIFLRHSTSKIETLDDLDHIQSLGFRGEALYSIGSIADVVLRSKTKNHDTGWEIHLRGGKKMNIRPVTMNNGTEIEVKELFFNTPARKKFLKTNTTEINQILNVFLPYTLLYPQCRFLLSHQEKVLIDLPPENDLKSRVAHALNLEEKHLLEVGQDFPSDQISLRMILGDINIQRPHRDLQFIFINDRPVQNRGLGFHMNQIYRLIFPPQIYPFFSLYIQIPPEDVDVNIHPAKREVKIKDEQHLSSLIRSVCEQTLMQQGKAKQVHKNLSFPNALVGNPNEVETGLKPVSTRPPTKTFGGDSFETSSSQVPEPFNKSKYATQHYAFQNQELLETPVSENLFIQNPDSLASKLSQARYVGTFLKKYLFFETGTSLFIVDQHAAQERIMFERLKAQLENGTIEVQQLLTPILLKLTPQELLNWEEAQEKFETLGLSTTLWNKETIALHTTPHLLKNPEAAARSLLAGENVSRYDNDTLARRACRCSVMAGDSMDVPQVEFQRQELLACRDPFTCPHGRPTVIEMTEIFFNKQFLRT